MGIINHYILLYALCYNTSLATNFTQQHTMSFANIYPKWSNTQSKYSIFYPCFSCLNKFADRLRKNNVPIFFGNHDVSINMLWCLHPLRFKMQYPLPQLLIFFITFTCIDLMGIDICTFWNISRMKQTNPLAYLNSPTWSILKYAQFVYSVKYKWIQ